MDERTVGIEVDRDFVRLSSSNVLTVVVDRTAPAPLVETAVPAPPPALTPADWEEYFADHWPLGERCEHKRRRRCCSVWWRRSASKRTTGVDTVC
jgi:hypothetical protein